MTKRGIDDLSFDETIQPGTGMAATNVTSVSAATGVPIKMDENGAHQTVVVDQFTTLSNGVMVATAATTSTDYYLNGNGSIAAINTTNNNGTGTTENHHHSVTKKFKTDNGSVSSSSIKSRVVHIRNIPPDTTTQELHLISSPFGTVTKHLFVRSKSQAFVEFESHFSALQMASYWIQTTIGGVPSQAQPTIRGRHVHVQISNHKELKTHYDNNHGGYSSPSNGTANANGGGTSTPTAITNGNSNSINGGAVILESYDPNDCQQHSSAGTSSTPSTVIRLVIENQIYPLGLDGIYQTFCRCGKVLKIVMFHKNQQLQALIQFGDITSSIQAKTNYDGQSIFAGAGAGTFNVMRIEYSKLQNLIVKYNNDKSRDFTGGAATAVTQNGTVAVNGSGNHHHLNHTGVTESAVTAAEMNSAAAGQLLAAAANPLAMANPAGAPFNPLTTALNLNGGHHHPHNAMTAAGLAAFASPAARYLSASAANAASLQQVLTNAALASGSLMSPSNAATMLATAAAAAAGLPATNLVFSSVVHVSGLNPEFITPDALFTLFGVYGDVIRVKILFNKKDTALIQMAEVTQAQNAISYLDRTRLFGKTMHVMGSKHQVVQMPREGHQDSGLTKDYTNSPLHRFKRPGSKNYNNIYPPSETLHVSNIPSSCTEEELRQAFQLETGKDIVKFKFFPNDRRMALVQFDSIENSILALIKMHNYKVAEHSHLRVSFSKSPV